VLTATLIAVVWYTYFTYRSVHREDPTHLLVDLNGVAHWSRIDLEFVLENRSARSVRTRQLLEIWVDKKPVVLDGFYSGREDLSLGPDDVFSRSFNFDVQTLGIPRTTQGVDPAPGYSEVHIRLAVWWFDDLKEEGRVGPRYWYAAVQTTPGVGPIIGAKHIEHVFKNFPQADPVPPGGWKSLRSGVTVPA
jgi:hypothetical protein